MHEALKEAKIKNKNLEKTTELGNHKVGNSGGLLALMVLFTAAAGSYLAYRHCKGVSRFGTKAARMVSEFLQCHYWTPALKQIQITAKRKYWIPAKKKKFKKPPASKQH